MEACDKGACADCPSTDENDCVAGLMRLAKEHISQMSEEKDRYHREYLRQKVETEYQTRRADLLHARLRRVYDLLIYMYVRTEMKEQTKEDNDNG